MKFKYIYLFSFLISFNSVSATGDGISDKGKDVNKIVQKDVLETANLMDQINLLKLKLEKEKLDKSLNEELLSNIEIRREIDKYTKAPNQKTRKIDPANGPFNPRGIKLLSVTSLQNSKKMAVFSFYGRKFNRGSSEEFKGAIVSINNNDVVFDYRGNSYRFKY